MCTSPPCWKSTDTKTLSHGHTVKPLPCASLRKLIFMEITVDKLTFANMLLKGEHPMISWVPYSNSSFKFLTDNSLGVKTLKLS